jgi:hypothetical protein
MTFPHLRPLARAAQHYHTEAGACLGIRCTLEVNHNPLAIHENLSQYYEELMHSSDGRRRLPGVLSRAWRPGPVRNAFSR